MKEVKHYISDDGKKESTDLNDIIEYESIQNIKNKTYIDIVNYRDRTCLYKLKDKKDLYYLSKNLHIGHPQLEDGYVGYVIIRYTDSDYCRIELISADQYIKNLKSKIDESNTEISRIENYIK